MVECLLASKNCILPCLQMLHLRLKTVNFIFRSGQIVFKLFDTCSQPFHLCFVLFSTSHRMSQLCICLSKHLFEFAMRMTKLEYFLELFLLFFLVQLMPTNSETHEKKKQHRNYLIFVHNFLLQITHFGIIMTRNGSSTSISSVLLRDFIFEIFNLFS